MYQVGDVVLCRFPYRNDPSQLKLRPALVMKVIKDGEIYKLAQITSSDRRNELCGYWVEHKSKENKSMNLRFDSFINLTSIMIVDELGIDHYIGKCPLMKELDELCKKARITY